MSAEQSAITPPRSLEGLAALLPTFEAAGFVFATVEGGDEVEPGVRTMPWSRLSDESQRFVEVAYEDGWVTGEVDWNAWMGTPEGERLTSDRSAIGGASVEQLQCLLTALVRGDRFAEGLLTAILQRVETLRREADEGNADA